MMYVVAGDAAAAAASASWSTLVHDRIFVPLGMTSSNTSVDHLVEESDVAIPHGLAPSLPLAAYTGTYGDSTFGTVTVALANGKLTLIRGDLNGVLTHWHHDVFQADWNIRWLGSSCVEFAVGPVITPAIK